MHIHSFIHGRRRIGSLEPPISALDGRQSDLPRRGTVVRRLAKQRDEQAINQSAEDATSEQ